MKDKLAHVMPVVPLLTVRHASRQLPHCAGAPLTACKGGNYNLHSTHTSVVI
jgi:hypothetical protein